tara:strand:- start:7264 stop:7452 length:189 start_codon:yes stop_codon:yes gene_type:complete
MPPVMQTAPYIHPSLGLSSGEASGAVTGATVEAGEIEPPAMISFFGDTEKSFGRAQTLYLSS